MFENLDNFLPSSSILCFASPVTLHLNRHFTICHTSLRHPQLLPPHNLPLQAKIIASSDPTPTQPMTNLPPGIVRGSRRFVIPDFVAISDPDLIRSISARSDIGRPATAKLPFFFRLFFQATKFYYPPGDSWVPALHNDGEYEQPQRHQNTLDSLASGFTEDHINRIQALMKGNDDLPTLGIKCAKIVAEVILPLPQGEQLPDDVAKASFDTLTDFNDTFKLPKYLRGRKARVTAEDYVRKLLPNEKYPGDIVHNLGAAAQGFSVAIQTLQGNLTEEIVPTLSKDAMIKSVIRVPLTTTTLDGIFPEDNPLIPDKTIIFLQIGAAAAKTEDTKFLFGDGNERRQCPFKNLFLSTTTEVRNRIISG